MSTPFEADGTTIQVDDGASSAYVAITNILTITPPASERTGYDSTHLASTAGIMTKAAHSRSEPGTWSFTMWNDETEYARLKLLEGVQHNFKLTYPNTAIDTIPGWISKVETVEMQNQEPSKLNVTCWVSGLVVRS